jgi:predicted transcriptional regulator YheO
LLKPVTKRPRSRREAASNAEAAAAPANQGLLAVLEGVAQALECSLNQHTEVVVHDLTRPESSIVGIVNGHVSGRRPGAPIIAGPSDDKAFDQLVGSKSAAAPNEVRVVANYTSRASDGRPLRSSSVVLFDGQGQPAAALCLNLDFGAMERLQRELRSALLPTSAPAPATPERSEPRPETSIEDLIEEIIATAIGTADAPVERMSKSEKTAAVAMMHERGLFVIRGSVELVAARLGVTKFTIYNYLDEIGAKRA